jgi:hypothetical protein
LQGLMLFLVAHRRKKPKSRNVFKQRPGAWRHEPT